MAHGHPDYAPVAGEALGGRGFLTYLQYGAGPIGAGLTGTINFGAVPANYELYQAIGIASANGCDTIHAVELFADAIRWRYNYFEVESTIIYPRHYIAVAGQVMSVKFYNWDNVERYFAWSATGIILDLGTRPLNPQRHPGAKPRLKKDERLWFADDTLYGKRWIKVKQEKIKDILEV